jgi:hypothetical protein
MLGNRQVAQLVRTGKTQRKGLTAEEKLENLKSEKFKGHSRLEAVFKSSRRWERR